MKMGRIMIAALSLLAFCAQAQQSSSGAKPTEMSCDDFVPTNEAQRRFAQLEGACEAIVERNGELYAKTTAIVRRVTPGSVRLYLPATDHTFTVEPGRDTYVLIGNQKVRPRDLQRGQEIHIYLNVNEFAKPKVEQVAMVTETEEIVVQPVEEVEALPTTASPLPALGLAGGLLLLAAGFVRRLRLRRT